MMQRELLLLQPLEQNEQTRENYRRMLATLVLDQVDFEFDEHNQLPDELPGDLSLYRNVLIYAEDYAHYAKRLAHDFPDADAYERKQSQDNHDYRFTPSRDGQRRLFVRPLATLCQDRQWAVLYWAMHLTMQSPGFKARQLARSDQRVFQQLFDRILNQWDTLAKESRLRPLKGKGKPQAWSEYTGILQRTLMDLSVVTGDERFHDIAEQSVRLYLADSETPNAPRTGDQFSIVESVVQLYEKTREPALRRFIQLRLKQRQENWQLWRGCYGLWPDDQWLRDSTLQTMVVPGVRAANVLTDSDIDRESIDQQAIHQAKLTEQLLRDEENGLYRFGSDGATRHTPLLIGHSSFWHLFALANLLTHLPRDTNGYQDVSGIFQRLAEALADVQDADGLWHGLLDQPDATIGDVIYTGGIVGALYRGLSLGVLEREPFEAVARRGLDGLKLRNFAGYAVGGAWGCALSPSPRYYMERPYGQDLHFGSWQQLYPMVAFLNDAQCDAVQAGSAEG